MNLFTQNIQVKKRCNVVLVKAKDTILNNVLVPTHKYSSQSQHWDTIPCNICDKLILKDHQYIIKKIWFLHFPRDRH